MEPPLGRRLYLAQRAQHDLLDARLSKRGASLWNWVLLRSAAEHDGASQRELAAGMLVEPPTLVRHLDKLAAEGLVERRSDDHDRRVTRVFVTQAGRRRLAELHEVVMEIDGELRALLAPREVDVLGKALLRIHEHFGSLKQEEDGDGTEP
ncbi:MAG: MarR family winged helix-turn-helix transcriptional regulator [Acidimicrobiia bacterium]